MRLTHATLLNPHFAVIDREDHGRYHLLTAPDHGDPHDHAEWGFWSEVLYGGYVEEVFDLKTDRRETIERLPGDRFRVEAGHIHRIVDLPKGVCLTHVAPDVHTDSPHAWSYRWIGGEAYRRPVHGGEWTRRAKSSQDVSKAKRNLGEPK